MYIDGGQFSLLNNGTPNYLYSTTVFSIDLSQNWTNSTVVIQSTIKPSGAPNLNGPSLWYDESRELFNSGFPGQSSSFDIDSHPQPPPLSLWTFQPESTGSGTWNGLFSPTATVWGDINRLDSAQLSMAEQANKHRKDVTFKVGDMVFLSNKNFNTERPSRKLDNKKWGPFKVVELIGSSYRLELPTTMRIHDVFHTNLLTLAPSNLLPEQRNPPTGPIVVRDQHEWELEDILDSRQIRGRLKYRVKWTGWDDDPHWYNTDRGEFVGCAQRWGPALGGGGG